MEDAAFAEGEGAADGGVHFFGRVDAEAMEHGGVKIFDGDGIGDIGNAIFGGVFFGIVGGFAIDETFSDASADEEGREAGGPVIATSGRIDGRCSTELAATEDEGGIE